MEGWKTYRLGDVAQIVKDSYNPKTGNHTPYIGLEHIEQQTLQLCGIGHSQDVTSNKFRFSSGDVLFGKLRPYFRKVYRPKFDGVCSTDIWVLRSKGAIDQGFLYYYVTTSEFIDLASQGSTGTHMPRADWQFLKKTEIDLPSLPVQHRIAEILGALDDKIELNRQMNQTLEQMAQALYRHYFIDDIDSENLPKGWKKGKLGEAFQITMGQSPDGKSYNTDKDGTLFFQGRTDFSFRFPDARLYTTEPKRYANILDTLVSVRAPVGDVNLANERCCIGRGLAAVQHKANKPSFTYYTLTNLYTEFAIFNGEGTVFGSINKDDFNGISMIIPTLEAIHNFEEKSEMLDGLILGNSKEIQRLTSIREILLPKLITGDLIPSDLQTIEQAL